MYTIIKISISLSITYDSAVRTFSKLACIKNMYRTNSPQENVTNLMVSYSKTNILDVININELIEKFASKNKTKIICKKKKCCV